MNTVGARWFTAGRLRRGLWIMALLMGARAEAQLTATGQLQPFSPFEAIGLLQAATFGDCPGSCGGADAFAGGTLTVNGQRIVVPRNTIVLLPATSMTWKELFDRAPQPYLSLRQTGLALTDGDGIDVPRPLGTFEVAVLGNRVNGVDIAGLVTIAQHSLHTGSGFITFIDYLTGELRVGGVLNDPSCIPGGGNTLCSGQRVKLNDPLGRFGRAWSPDVRFTIDEENPTVRAATGFPMCVPRADPGSGAGDALCPQTNRIRDFNGNAVTSFYMNAPALHAAPDPSLMAPLVVGDYVTYSGILVRDGPTPTAGLPDPTNLLVAAYAVVANVSIFTQPGTDPAYVALDESLLGVGGIEVPGFPQEASTRTRFEGFTTDPTRTVTLWGVDVDPCTGAIADRSWGSVGVDPGPPTGAVLGRFRFRPPDRILSMPTAGVFLPAPREVRAVVGGYAWGAVTPSGLVAGQYRAPMAEYIFPENLGPGTPPVPFTFNEFPFLMNGSGPWPGAGGAIVGRLDPAPWDPSLNAAPTACAPPATVPAPTSVAGASQTVGAGTLVTLDGAGSSSNSTPPQPLAFLWTQAAPAAGPFVVLSNPTAAQPTFVAPIVAQPTDLVFQLAVSDAGGTATANVTITVNPPPSIQPPTAVLAAPASVVSGALVSLDASASTDGNVPATSLTYAFVQVSPASPAATVTPAGATATFRAPLVATATTFTFAVTVTNAFGLLATSTPVSVTVGPAAAPIVQPLQNQLVLSGNPPTGIVTLAAVAADPNGLPLTYTWTQVSGPTRVILAPGGASASPTATFPAPTLPAGTAPIAYGFQLSVTNGVTPPVLATMTVTVSAPDAVVVTSVVYRRARQRLTVNATTTAPAGSNVTLSFHVAAPLPGGATVQMTDLGGTPHAFTGTLVGTPNPDATGGVQVTSSLGGTATSTVTSLRP